MVLNDEELTFDEAYKDGYRQELLKLDCLKLFGYYIDSPDAFIDEVINNRNLSEAEFLPYFLSRFPKSIIFNEEYHNK